MRFLLLYTAWLTANSAIVPFAGYSDVLVKSSITLGIDFGTSNSLVGAWKNGRRIEALSIDPAAADPTLMRTLLHFPDADHCSYGSQALQSYLDSEMEGRFFRSFKSHLPNRSYLGTILNNRVLTLESLVGIFLLELRRRAEAELGESIDSAVIGRPARYSLDAVEDEFALFRMRKAVEFAGFKNFTFVPEPLAAAFDYRRQLVSEKTILIGDFGGGTSDFTLIRIGPFPFKKEHVLGMDGASVAGDAFDSLFMSEKLNRLFGAHAQYKVSLGRNVMTMPPSVVTRLNQPAHIVHLMEKDTHNFIREVRKCALSSADKAAIDRLLILVEDQQIFSFFENIERTKRQLSAAEEADFHFDYPGLETTARFSRKLFETWARPAFEKIFSALDRCLQHGQLTPDDVDLVCLTGGSAKVLLIRAEFERRFGVEKLQTQSHFHSVLSGLIESAGFASDGQDLTMPK